MSDFAPMTPLGEFVYTTKYARWIPEESRRETWAETVDRYVDFFRHHLTGFGLSPSDPAFAEVRQAILDREILPSMRALASAGKGLSGENLMAFNCSYLSVRSPRAFPEALYLSMCGVGVGFGVREGDVAQLPVVPGLLLDTDDPIVVPDSRQGWAEAFEALISGLYAGRVRTWDVTQVRPAGAYLKSSGGRASGPQPLIDLFEFTVALFRGAAGRQLTSLEAHDLMTMTASIAQAGGKRRSAMISLFSQGDEEMLSAKSGPWWEDASYRAFANNSVAVDAKPSKKQFAAMWDALVASGSGEPGFVNMTGRREHASRFGGRDGSRIEGVNPCCFAGDTLIFTDEGPRRIDSITSETKVWVDGALVAASQPWLVGIKPVLRLTTDEGYTINVTKEHKFETVDGEKVEAQHLVPGQLLCIHNHGDSGAQWSGTDEGYGHGYITGHFLGDGSANYTNPRGYVSTPQLRLYEGDGDVSGMRDAALTFVEGMSDRRRSDATGWQTGCSNGLQERLSIKRSWVEPYVALQAGKYALLAVEETSSEFHRGFLRGMFDTDGHIEGSAEKGFSVRLGQSNLQTLEVVQRMLLRLGIKSVIRDGRPARTDVMPDGRGGSAEYECRQSWRLIISGANVEAFAREVGFFHGDKARKLEALLSRMDEKRGFYEPKFTVRFAGLEEVGEQPVYDMEAFDERHVLDANGFVASNSEALLRDMGLCNLTEVRIDADATVEDVERRIRLASVLGTWQSTLTNFGYVRSGWVENAREERLLGVSLTGHYSNPLFSDVSDAGLPGRLSGLRDAARAANEMEAERLGVNASVAITLGKPSGSTSALMDVASGIHPYFAPFYLRRIRVSKVDPVANLLVDSGVPSEEDAMNAQAMVFTLPVRAPEGAIVQADLAPLEHLELVAIYSEYWCEHTQSCTITVKPEEWAPVGEWVFKNWDRVGGVSFLPAGDGTVYPQMPYEACDEVTYRRLVEEFPAVDWRWLAFYESEDGTKSGQTLACSAGGCDDVDLVQEG